MDELRDLFQRKLDETRESIRRHAQLERELLEGLAYLKTCRECATPSTVKVCVNCSQDHGMKEEPALVAGIMLAFRFPLVLFFAMPMLRTNFWRGLTAAGVVAAAAAGAAWLGLRVRLRSPRNR